MNYDSPESVAQWLASSPPFDRICAEFPEEWERVQNELAVALSSGRAEDVQSYLKRLSGPMPPARPQGRDRKALQAAVSQAVRHALASAAVKRHCISVATGIESGTVRFNLLNGLVAQWLLFSEGLVRKPVSLFWFRLIWLFVWQKRFLMPLVQPQGIYCFYSSQLISELAALIGSRSCLEIAAGDGTLSRFLSAAGVSITATDDYSWSHAVTYPAIVRKQDAKEALVVESPQVVICSWPPAGNRFERHVFRTRSVELYIVIGSTHRFAAGNWSAYEEQTAFRYEENPALGRLVVPPELDSAVYLFRRKEAKQDKA